MRVDFNENYFENIDTEDKAYFLGFIMADGCILKNRNTLKIIINKKDKHILEDFSKCIDFKGSIYTPLTRNHMCSISMSNIKLKNDLNKLGIISNKTKTLELPIIRKDLYRHLLRGFFDGDGCIRLKEDSREGKGGKRGDLRFVCASQNLLNQINEHFNKEIGTNLNKLYGQYDTFKYLGWSGFRDIESIYNYLYKNSNYYLIRKKLIFDEVYNICISKKRYRKK